MLGIKTQSNLYNLIQSLQYTFRILIYVSIWILYRSQKSLPGYSSLINLHISNWIKDLDQFLYEKCWCRDINWNKIKLKVLDYQTNNIDQQLMILWWLSLPARCVKDVTFTILEDTGLLSRSGNRSFVKANAPI